MTQEEKELLLRDLCARLSYGVKILHTGWDYDRDTDFDTVETLIGIDDRFIYTVWDKTGDRKKHCLSVSNWKPYLHPMSSMTEEEREEYHKLCDNYYGIYFDSIGSIDWLNSHHFNYRIIYDEDKKKYMSMIEKGFAIEVTEENNPYKP